MFPSISKKTPVVVVGSGVIGLTTALSLQRTGRYSVTVVADNLTSDIKGPYGISQDWASPFAGANWRPIAGEKDKLVRAAEEESYFRLRDLARVSPETGIRIAPMVDFGMHYKEVPVFFNYVVNLRKINTALWPKNAAFGYTYDSIIIDVLKYLPWLTSQFEQYGGKVKRGKLDHILDALKYSEENATVIINCTAMGSRILKGVADNAVYPTRGQTILVHAPNVKCTMVLPTGDATKDTYIIPRGDGSVILGGVFQEDNYDRAEDVDTTEEIIRNCISLCPELIDKKQTSPHKYNNYVSQQDIDELKKRIIRVNVGLRPTRHGGPRLEIERMDGVTILHNYGQGGFGYQTSWGFGSATVRILDFALEERPKL